MQSYQDNIVKIVERSSNLFERLSGKFYANELKDKALVECQLDRWCQVVSQNNLEEFEKRLLWDKLSVNKVRHVLDNVCLANTEILPEWAETLRQIIQATIDFSSDKVNISEFERFIDTVNPIPFEDIFIPFVQVARKKLITQAGKSYLLLSEKAHASLERSLLGSLSNLSSQTLNFEFALAMNFKQSSLSKLISQIESETSEGQYEEFVRNLIADGMVKFFNEYSVLARLLAVKIDFWVDATKEFLERLFTDLTIIQTKFKEKGDLGQVTHVVPNLSDPHNGGRSVIALTFASGLKLIYKPKDLSLEITYYQLLDWLNQQKIKLKFKIFEVINCSTHGWILYVEHLPCQNEGEAKHFYQRAGMLLCLLYVLGATDCHWENLIAHGEYPVLIDMETLMQPHISNRKGSEKLTDKLVPALKDFKDSVLRTGLLPRWQQEKSQKEWIAYDVSGLGGGSSKQNIPVRTLKWSNINTNHMSLKYEYRTKKLSCNLPFIDNTILIPGNYINELIEGFESIYNLLIRQRDVVLNSNLFFKTLKAQKIRFVFQNTKAYGSILNHTLNPQYLRLGVRRSIELDVLSNFQLPAKNKPFLWSILEAEKRSLEQMDIPFFTAYSDSRSLKLSSAQEPNVDFFQESAYESFVSRIEKLDNEDLLKQIKIIKGAFFHQIKKKPVSAHLTEEVKKVDCIIPLTQEQMVNQAIALAEVLHRQVLNTEKNSANWIGLVYKPEVEQLHLAPLGYDLYSGYSGIALFLAALAKVTGRNEEYDLALKTLQPLNEAIKEISISDINLGGAASGFASTIYVLIRNSEFLDHSGLLESAIRAATFITPKLIYSDRAFDITNGTAGVILVLLALYKATAQPQIIEQAIVCGQYLLSNRVTSDSGSKTWKTPEGQMLTGFAHGAAGIAYALSQLYEATQDTAYLNAAREAMRYEKSVFSSTASNWPDFRTFSRLDNGEPTFATQWCHGAPGVLLARLGSLSVFDTDEVRQEIEIALNTTLKHGIREVDRLCCGNFGRIEALLVASQKLQRPQLAEIARKQASWVVSRALKRGSFTLHPSLSGGAYSLDFFQGISGIGYELLRLAYPNALPSVLLWN